MTRQKSSAVSHLGALDLLMGGREAQLLEGYCDLAEEGETFKRMRAEALCRKAAFRRYRAPPFSGSDRRTRLNKDTRDIIFFVFSVPDMGLADVQEGMEAVRSSLKDHALKYMPTSMRAGWRRQPLNRD